MSQHPSTPEPLLRTLAPMLRDLEGKLRPYVEGGRLWKLDIVRKNSLTGIEEELRRRSEELSAKEPPLLVIMLMGGTGVGKSTFLNALAGAPIASASFTRPTTRDPVVYFHESVRPERLDPKLRLCKLQTHNRPELLQKVIVDTPDLDSCELAHRETLFRLLPVSDIVLYVGSQEKYHDKLGWDLFLKERHKRAFAFVLNKWDRCLQPGAAGVRPDEDLLKDLKAEGFANPLLFRTSAQLWVNRATNEPQTNLPEGEQFAELLDWLENKLTQLEIEAIKAQGVQQLLAQLAEELKVAAPPDLSEPARKARGVWERSVRDEAKSNTEILLSTLDPQQQEIENHFSIEGKKRFRPVSLMRGYLGLFTGAKYVGTTLRDRFSLFPKRGPNMEATSAWDVHHFTRECIRVAGERFLDNRVADLTRRLIINAEEAGFPTALLAKPCDDAGKLDWRQRHEIALRDALLAAEQVWKKPTGPRRWLQFVLVGCANFLPEITLIASLLMIPWKYYMITGYDWKLVDLLMPLVLTLISLIMMQVLISLLLPMRWPVIRGEFARQLEKRLRDSFEETYLPIPGDVAAALEKEKQQTDALRADVEQVAAWLREREQKANIAAMYGN